MDAVGGKRFLSAFGLIAMMLLGVACGTASNETASQPSAQRSQPSAATQQEQDSDEAPPLRKFRFGVVQPLFWQSPLFLGKEKGIYEKHGIDLEVVNISGSPNLMKAYLANEVDSVSTNSLEQMTAMESGAKIKFISAYAPGNPYILFGKKEIKDVPDLKGRTIGVSQAGGFPQTVVIFLLDAFGLGKDDVTWVSIGSEGDRIRAAVAGKIDAAIATVEYIKEIEDNGLKVLSIIREDQPRFISQGMSVHQRLLDEDPQLVVDALAAHLEAIRYAMEHKDEVVAERMQALGIDEETASRSFDIHINSQVWWPDGYVPPETFEYMQDINVKLGFQKEKIPIDKMATWDIQKAAIEKIGPYKP